MKIKIMGKTNCPYCTKVVSYLQRAGEEFSYQSLKTEEQRDALKKMGITTVPAVFVNDVYLGGYDETVRYVGIPEEQL